LSSANAKVLPESKKISTSGRIRMFLLKMQSLNIICPSIEQVIIDFLLCATPRSVLLFLDFFLKILFYKKGGFTPGEENWLLLLSRKG
jgi:hypothetical protein